MVSSYRSCLGGGLGLEEAEGLGVGVGKALEEGTGCWGVSEAGGFGLLLEEDRFSKGAREGEFKTIGLPTPLLVPEQS